MVKAFVLVETVAGHTKSLVNSLKVTEGVSSIAAVTGPYDVIVVFEGADLHSINGFVNDILHVQPGIIRTTSCIELA